MTRTGLRLIAGIVLATQAHAAGPSVRYEDGRLWIVTASKVRPATILEAITDKTGVEFRVDEEVNGESIDFDVQGLSLERAIRTMVSQMPKAGGQTIAYIRRADGEVRISRVDIFSTSPGEALALKQRATPTMSLQRRAAAIMPTPDLEDRKERMIDAGVPEETAEKVIELTREVQRLQATPEPGTYSPDDLSSEGREQLDTLIERGVPMERGVQMLLLQERYQDTLRELSELSGRNTRQ